jgi:hypothetical protein
LGEQIYLQDLSEDIETVEGASHVLSKRKTDNVEEKIVGTKGDSINH